MTSVAPDSNTLSLAQNIQKITQVLSQKISNFNKQLQNKDPPQKAMYLKPEASKSKKRVKEDSSDDEVDVGDEIKPNSRPALHNIPKVSGSNLMIKSKNKSIKNLMNFNKMKYMTI